MDISNIGSSHIKSVDSSRVSSGFTKEDQGSVISTQDEFVSTGNRSLGLRTEVEKHQSKDKVVRTPLRTRQYADNRGRVTHLALMLGNNIGGNLKEQLMGVYKTLFSRMEPDTKFSICVGSDRIKKDVEELIKKNNIPNPERFNFHFPPSSSFTIWARDMLVAGFNPNQPDMNVMINSAHIHSRDGNIPPFLAAQDSSLKVVNTPTLVTDGGDTVATATDSFVGYDSVEKTKQKLENLAYHYPEFNNWARNYYVNVMGKTIESGESIFKTVDPLSEKKSEEIDPSTLKNFIENPSPLTNSLTSELNLWAAKHHLIPCDDEIGDPGLFKSFFGGSKKHSVEDVMFEDLAIKLFEEYFDKPVTAVGKDDPNTPEIEKPAVFHQDMCMTPVDDTKFFLADPDMFRRMVSEMSPEDLKKANRQFSEVCGYNIDLQSYINKGRAQNVQADFNAYERTLKDKGYDVVRIPYQFSYTTSAPSFTYNNCLMERFEKEGEQVKRVFLPVIGVDYFDSYAIKQYEKEGFEVIPIPMGEVCKLQGELRCITNWLGRSEKV